MSVEEDVIRVLVESKGAAGVRELRDEFRQASRAVDELDQKYQAGDISLRAYTRSLEDLEKRQQRAGDAVRYANTLLRDTAIAKAAGSTRDLGRSVLEASRAIEDFTFAGLKGILNNIPTTVQALGGGAGLAGVVSLLAVGFSVLQPHILKFLESLGAGASGSIPQARTALEGLTKELGNLAERQKKLEEQGKLTNAQMLEYNAIRDQIAKTEEKITAERERQAVLDSQNKSKTEKQTEAAADFNKAIAGHGKDVEKDLAESMFESEGGQEKVDDLVRAARRRQIQRQHEIGRKARAGNLTKDEELTLRVQDEAQYNIDKAAAPQQARQPFVDAARNLRVNAGLGDQAAIDRIAQIVKGDRGSKRTWSGLGGDLEGLATGEKEKEAAREAEKEAEKEAWEKKQEEKKKQEAANKKVNDENDRLADERRKKQDALLDQGQKDLQPFAANLMAGNILGNQARGQGYQTPKERAARQAEAMTQLRKMAEEYILKKTGDHGLAEQLAPQEVNRLVAEFNRGFQTRGDKSQQGTVDLLQQVIAISNQNIQQSAQMLDLLAPVLPQLQQLKANQRALGNGINSVGRSGLNRGYP